MPSMPRRRRKEFVGTVVSDKMQKTRVVVIDWMAPDAETGKYVRRSLRLKAHDEKNEAKFGDRVRVRETRPMSREKRWRIVQIVERSRRPPAAARKRGARAASAPEVA